MVSDGIDESRPDKVIITSTASNQGPIAYGGPDQVVTTGSTIILDGTNSYNPDKDALTYSWSLISKPQDSKAYLANTDGKISTFTADVAGIYGVELKINNSRSVSEPDTVAIIALGQDSKIRVATNKSRYTTGDILELYLWVGNLVSTMEKKVDVFIGFGFPNDSLFFFDPSLNLNISDPKDSRSYIPFAREIALIPGFLFPSSAQMDTDSDGNGKLDTFRFFSVTLPSNLPAGSYFAFAALAELGSAQAGSPQPISPVSLAYFSFTP